MGVIKLCKLPYFLLLVETTSNAHARVRAINGVKTFYVPGRCSPAGETAGRDVRIIKSEQDCAGMTDELVVCAAAFFRSIGKDVTTVEEFVMSTSLDMKWMSRSDSESLLALMVKKGVLTKKGEYVRPSGDISGVDVPLAYRPSKDIIDALHPQKKDPAPDMFHILMDTAVKSGMERRDFIQNCNKIQKRLDVDIGVAALIVLRDNGQDISPYVDDVNEFVREA